MSERHKGQLAYLLDNGAVLSHGEELPVAHNVASPKVVDVVSIGCSLDGVVLGTPRHDGGSSTWATHGDLGRVACPWGVGGLLVSPTQGAV